MQGMKLLWCWRCKAEMPMLDEAEFGLFASKRGAPDEGNSGSDQYGAALAEYERITGYRETNFAAIWHHRLALYGPPCKSCGKPLRTPQAKLCGSCMTPVALNIETLSQPSAASTKIPAAETPYEILHKIHQEPMSWLSSMGVSGHERVTALAKGCEILVKAGLTYHQVKRAIQESPRVLDALADGDYARASALAPQVVAPTKLADGTPTGRTEGLNQTKQSHPVEIDYVSLSDEPKPYIPPVGVELNSTKRQIVEVGRTVDKFVTDNLKLLFERTVCQGKTPRLLFADGTSDTEKLSIAKAFDPNRSEFVPTLAACCTAVLLGKTLELSSKKWMFVQLFDGLIADKNKKLRAQFPELPNVLSHAAFAACYGRYLEHDGKIGLLFTPYLGYVRALNRSLVSEAYRFSTEIETTYKGKNRILSMLEGLGSNNFFAPLSDNPNVFKIPQLVVDWFTRNVPLG